MQITGCSLFVRLGMGADAVSASEIPSKALYVGTQQTITARDLLDGPWISNEFSNSDSHIGRRFNKADCRNFQNGLCNKTFIDVCSQTDFDGQ